MPGTSRRPPTSPLIPMGLALADARTLDISREAMEAFLGGNALRVFPLPGLGG